MKIVRVQCENLFNPIGIDIIHPRLTWCFEGKGKQVSYRVNYKINEETRSSGWITSSSMSYIFNDEFHSRDIVNYEIEVKNENGEIIKSEINSFEFGLLKQEEFIASWISGNYKVDKKRRYPADYFKKEFEVKDIKKARLYITACGLYEISLNGMKVGDKVLSPGSSQYHKRIQYQTYDCISYLKEGKNVLEIVLGDGYFRGTSGAWGRRNIFGNETKLYVQLELYNSKNEVFRVLSNDSFAWSNDGPIGINDLKDGERVDARKVISYKGKAKLTSFQTTFRSSNNESVKEQEEYEAIEEIITPSGQKVFKFPKMIAGYISLKVDAKSGDFIRLVMGEMLDKDGEFNLRNIQCRSKKKISPLQEIDYICKAGLNVYKPKFYFGGFRYVLVESNLNITLKDIKAIAIYNNFDKVSTFETSNELINTFYQNTINSTLSNHIEVPMDCPTRERAGWSGDAQIFFNTASYLLDYASFSRKYLEDMKDEQFKNGAFRQINPTIGEDWYMKTLNGSVGWSCAGILIPYRHYLKYGDKRILENNFEAMEKYASFMMKRTGKWGGLIARPIFLSRKNRKYLVNKGQSYGEWLEPNEIFKQKWTDIIFVHPEVSTAYTHFTLSIFLKVCEILKKEEDIKKILPYVSGTKNAYQELVTKKRFSLDTKRQACLVRPLYMHLLNEAQEEFAKKKLIEDLNDFDWRIGTGFLSTPFILDVLADIDTSYAYKLLENEKMPGWLFMAKNSTTSIWESWEGNNSETNIDVASLNHYSKGVLVEFLFRRVLGIDIDSENTFKIMPLIGGSLTYAKGSYYSIYGKMSLTWKKEDENVIFYIEVPANTKAKFIYKDENIVLEDGKHHLVKKF